MMQYPRQSSRMAAVVALVVLVGSSGSARAGQPIPSVKSLADSLPCTVDFFDVDGCHAFLIRPKGKADLSPMPWVWYAPVIGHPNSSHQVMPDGLVALAGGRPGLFLWLNPDGTAATWHKLDVLANHNAHRPEEPIKTPGNTSSYTEVIPLDESHLLYVYDRIPFGWSAIPADSSETNSVWVVRVALSRLPSPASD